MFPHFYGGSITVASDVNVTTGSSSPTCLKGQRSPPQLLFAISPHAGDDSSTLYFHLERRSHNSSLMRQSPWSKARCHIVALPPAAAPPPAEPRWAPHHSLRQGPIEHQIRSPDCFICLGQLVNRIATVVSHWSVSPPLCRCALIPSSSSHPCVKLQPWSVG
jgi:hypothetical protein